MPETVAELGSTAPTSGTYKLSTLAELEQIKTWVGISTKTRSNDVVITSILNVLFNCGLIDFKIVEKTSKDDNFLNIKTMYQLIGVNTKLKTPTVERIKIKN